MKQKFLLKTHSRYWIWGVSFFLILLFVIASSALVWMRMRYLDVNLGEYVNCKGCFAQTLLVNDAPYIGFLIILLILSFSVSCYWLSIPLRFFVLAVLFFYALDVLTLTQLSSRLRLADLRAYASNPGVLWTHIVNTGGIGGSVNFQLAGVLIFCFSFILWPGGLFRIRQGLLIVLSIAVTVTLVQRLPTREYVHNWMIRNVAAINFSTGVSTPYDTKKIQSVANAIYQPVQCYPGAGQRKNIILVLLESWSPYQSFLFGGWNDWTPELDQIARDNIYYTHMTAAGFTSKEGRMGLLSGLEFFSPVNSFFEVDSLSWKQPHNVVGLLNQRGYRTAFLTSGDLAFSDTKPWLEALQFRHIEGHDQPEYEGKPRLHFNSVSDDVLYQRVLSYMDTLNKEEPYFLMVTTVSSHLPYIQPYTGEKTDEAVFRFIDKSIGDFYRELKSRRFFDNGVLFITSDHRTMTPITLKEQNFFGRAAASRIPAIWVDGQHQQAVEEPFHQADFKDTIAWLTGTEICSPRGYRSMLDLKHSVTPRCLFHARGDDRDLIDVFCPEGEGTVLLRGDKTYMRDSHGLSSAREEEILKQVGDYRIRREFFPFERLPLTE